MTTVSHLMGRKRDIKIGGGGQYLARRKKYKREVGRSTIIEKSKKRE